MWPSSSPSWSATHRPHPNRRPTGRRPPFGSARGNMRLIAVRAHNHLAYPESTVWACRRRSRSKKTTLCWPRVSSCTTCAGSAASFTWCTPGSRQTGAFSTGTTACAPWRAADTIWSCSEMPPWGVEFPDTLDGFKATEGAVREAEQQLGFSASNRDFLAACVAALLEYVDTLSTPLRRSRERPCGLSLPCVGGVLEYVDTPQYSLRRSRAYSSTLTPSVLPAAAVENALRAFSPVR